MKDFPDARRLLSSELVYRGKVWEIVRDEIDFNSKPLVRDYLRHPGAVAVVALDQLQRVLLISQYRHPVGLTMVEIPAGLLDLPAEDPLEAAKRELLEETGYVANEWSTLVDLCTTPGSSSEAIRIYLAQDLSHQPDVTYLAEGEETEIQVGFQPLNAAVKQVLAGEIQSPTAVAGILSAVVSLSSQSSRPADAMWPIRDHLIRENRVFKF